MRLFISGFEIIYFLFLFVSVMEQPTRINADHEIPMKTVKIMRHGSHEKNMSPKINLVAEHGLV